MKITILSVGKTKERWLDEAFDEYVKRLKPIAEVRCLWAKNDPQLVEWVGKEKNVVCLDPQGLLYTSEQFAAFASTRLEKGGARLSFVIGGAEGLPAVLREKHELLALSPLTFTHQITRLILIEQIYRAFEIGKGSAYHK